MTAAPQIELTKYADFDELARRLRSGGDGRGVDGIHCPRCGQRRRADVSRVYGNRDNQRSHNSPTAPWCPPDFYDVRCVQCHTDALAVIYEGPEGADLIILWSIPGGLATPQTPRAVAYYLNQAARAESAGARSAAVAMYRAALEHLLVDKGFGDSLHKNIAALEKASNDGTAKWAADVDADVLRILKDLGNAAIHSNGGHISKQAALDAALVADVQTAFAALLEFAYEAEARKAALKARLAQTHANVK